MKYCTRLNSYIFVVIAAAVGGLFTAVALSSGEHHWMAIGLFALAMVAVQLLPLPVPRGRDQELMSFEEALAVPLILMLSPGDAAIAALFGVAASHLILRAAPIKLIFNSAQLLLAVLAASSLLHLVGGNEHTMTPMTVIAVLAGIGAMFIVNQLLVIGVLSLTGAGTLRTLLFDGMGVRITMWMTNAAVGLLLFPAAIEVPWLLMVATVPLLTMHLAWSAQIERLTERERLRRLQVVTHDMSRTLDVATIAERLRAAVSGILPSEHVAVRFEAGTRPSCYGVDTAPARAADRHITLIGATGLKATLEVWVEREAHIGAQEEALLGMLIQHGETALDNAILLERAMGQRQKLAQIFDHSTEGLMVLGPDGRITSWNPAMQGICHFTAADVMDSPVSLISPQIAEIIEGSTAGQIDANVSTEDGSRRSVRASYAPFRKPGEDADSWVVVLRDITKETETERLKDDFVATVSHELRTPLTALTGFIETMRRDDVDLGQDQIEMFLDIMSQQADRLGRLINDLLDVSAMEHGRPIRVDVRPLDVATELQRALQGFELARPEARVNIKTPETPLLAMADPHRLQQIILNLLENAIKHGGGASDIDIHAQHMADDYIRIQVIDHGQGIQAADIPHIFERFFITANSVTRNGGGAGLGLYICRRLAQAMHGSLRAESVINEGTTFSLELPAVHRMVDAEAGTSQLTQN